MKKLSLLLIVFLLAQHVVHAEAVLGQIPTLLTITEVAQGKFRQEKRLKFLRKPLLSEGEFIYSRGRGIIWKTLSPVASVLFMNQKRLLLDQTEQVLPPQFGRIFQALLGGEVESLVNDFNIRAEEKKSNWHVHMSPKDEMMQKIVRAMELSGDTEVRSLDVEEVSGNVTKISFHGIAHSNQLTSGQLAEFARFPP